MTDTNTVKFNEEQAALVRAALLNFYPEFAVAHGITEEAKELCRLSRELSLSRVLDSEFSPEKFQSVTEHVVRGDDDFCDLKDVMKFLRKYAEKSAPKGVAPVEVTEDLAWAFLAVQRMTCPFDDLEIGESFFLLGSEDVFLRVTKKKALHLPSMKFEDDIRTVEPESNAHVLPIIPVFSELFGADYPEEYVNARNALDDFYAARDEE